jgi:hypothetical protein
MMTGRDRQPLIVTAADHRFARTLMQLLLSAERWGEDRRAAWLVYDLGLSDADRRQLASRFPWATLQPFPLGNFPPHVAVASGSYAWKPLIIAEAAKRGDGPLIWFDSGTLLKAPVDEALQALAKQGFWGLRSQMPLAQKCDPRVLDALEVPLEVRHVREYAAGAVGFDLATPLGRHLVEAWARHALIPGHIVPENYPPYHKHDQALLNCLLAKAMFAGDFEPTLQEIDISSAHPSSMISTRNHVPAGRPLWTDPLYRFASSAWKAGDRLYHRARLFDDTRLDGRKRRRQDHFTVTLRQLPGGRETVIPGPADGYYADPFITRRDGKLWLFLEEFVYPRDRGFLTVLGLDDGLNVTSTEAVEFLPGYAALDSHASFPCIFEIGGESYMIPETHERRAIDLYVCDRWPSRWRLRRRLRFGVDAADSMLVEKGGLWYLITSVQGSAANRHLEVHYTDDVLSGCFHPHPINNQNVYGGNANGTGRNAGVIGKQPDGTLLRLMQDSPNYYGQGIRPMRVTALSPTEFREEHVDLIDFLPGIVVGFPTHHATRTGDILAFDTRDRVG